MSEKKNSGVSARPREVGVLTNGRLYMPLPRDLETFQAMRGNAHSLAGMIASYDLYALHAAALNADRTILYDVDGEREAREESRTARRHDHEISVLYRKKEKLEAELEVELVEQKLDAVREFKPIKSDLGKARFAKRQAEIEVEEAVAREGMVREEVIEPEPVPTAKAKALSASIVLARLIDELEVEIAKAEADGKPTVELRSQQDALNIALRRKLMQEDE